ncbi:MAG: nucleoside triphosphate pyrophosphohydrolase [Pseudoflavonifractor sp.]|nr:nucleoside triphosphate pyrophosphohydrolase [Alloprevotella sp.]MCM1117296.1 nucleoside triphosphate pyrophosphohydrolase [Pseudoflavonifractor sp.]
MKTRQEKIEALGRVIDTLDRLRVECPWDRKQTNESLRPNTIEEVYELADALIASDNANIAKELGDVLLHVLFYAKIGEEKEAFDIADVADRLNEKLIYRHPHIFGDATAETASQVSNNWEKLKLKEKGGNKTVLSGVPSGLPALIKAYRIQEKAANVGFDWDNADQVWDKVKEETGEFEAEAKAAAHDGKGKLMPDDLSRMEEEMGDLLFSLVNASRLYGIHPDTALDRTCRKFIRRFTFIEEQAKAQGRNITDLSLSEMDSLWNKAKNSLS